MKYEKTLILTLNNLLVYYIMKLAVYNHIIRMIPIRFPHIIIHIISLINIHINFFYIYNSAVNCIYDLNKYST